MADANAGSSSSLSSPSEPLPRSGVVTSSSTHSPSRPRQSTGPLTPASCASGPGSCSSPSPAQAAKRELTQTPPRLVAQTAKQKVLSMATPLRYWLMHLASTAETTPRMPLANTAETSSAAAALAKAVSVAASAGCGCPGGAGGTLGGGGWRRGGCAVVASSYLMKASSSKLVVVVSLHLCLLWHHRPSRRNQPNQGAGHTVCGPMPLAAQAKSLAEQPGPAACNCHRASAHSAKR